MAQTPQAEVAAEKVVYFVIPSEARDLLFCSAPKKQQIPRANTALRNDMVRVYPQPVQPVGFGRGKINPRGNLGLTGPKPHRLKPMLLRTDALFGGRCYSGWNRHENFFRRLAFRSNEIDGSNVIRIRAARFNAPVDVLGSFHDLRR